MDDAELVPRRRPRRRRVPARALGAIGRQVRAVREASARIRSCWRRPTGSAAVPAWSSCPSWARWRRRCCRRCSLAASIRGWRCPPCGWSASPARLLFDGYVVIAHTLGAACAAGAALLLLRQLDERRSWIALGGAAVLLVVGMLLRTEMLFMGFALAAAVAIVGITRRSRGTVAHGPRASSGGRGRLRARPVAPGAHPGGRRRHDLGGRRRVGRADLPGGSSPSASRGCCPRTSADGAAALVLVVAAMAAVAVVLARRTPPERDGVRLFAVVAAVAAVARLAFGGSPVPGLLVAFPLFVAGLAALRRDTFAGTPARFLGATLRLLRGRCVWRRSTATAGSGEWGGRYFAIGLPLIVPVLLLALRDVGRRLDRQTARVALASALVVSIASCALAIITLRDAHQAVDRARRRSRPSRPAKSCRRRRTSRRAHLQRLRWAASPSRCWIGTGGSPCPPIGSPSTRNGCATSASDRSHSCPAMRRRISTSSMISTWHATRPSPSPGWTITTLDPCTQPNGCSPTR